MTKLFLLELNVPVATLDHLDTGAHGELDEAKVARLMAAWENPHAKPPPLLLAGDLLYSGCHRLEAARRLGCSVDLVRIWGLSPHEQFSCIGSLVRDGFCR